MPTPDPTPATDASTAAAPAADAPVGSATQAPPPLTEDKPKYVAKGPIFIGGIRAYNEGDAVAESAVKNNKLEDLVKKV